MNDEIAPILGNDAAAVKKQASAKRAEFTRAVADLERQQAEAKADLERQRSALEAEFKQKRAELEQQMEPLREQLAKMREVMWTVDLYLGRGESLQLLRDGQPAPADTPITIRQKVLVMAEESLVMMDKSVTGMNADNIPEFIDWLLEDTANLDRVLPEQRGVVVLIPTRVESRSGNAFEDAARNAENRSSWWLLRNGERLYLLSIDSELKVTERVLPHRDEFTRVFDKRLFGFGGPAGEPVRPGSDEWLALEKRADAMRRHYMRILLVLQGIIDRTPVWHPLPPAGVNLMSLADQDSGKIVLLQDDEDSIQLTDGRESFGDWQRRLNELLRPGLRVIGNWNNRDFWDAQNEYSSRLHPRTVSSVPQADVPHLIEGRRKGGLVIRFERTDQVWRRNVPVPDRPGYVYRGEMPGKAEKRASCLILPGDTWVLPYDLVTVAELEYYLNRRDDRSKHFLSMVPTVRAALAAKRAEVEQEEPFRDLLTRTLINEGAEAEEASALIEELVQWWKIANTWSRPLNGAPDHEAKAVRDIVTEFHARNGHIADQVTVEAVAAGQAVSGAICVARNRQGQWHVYVPSSPAHDEGVFLDVTRIRRNGTLGETKTWQTVPQRSASILHVAWSTPEWQAWKFSANPRTYLSGPERDNLIAQAIEQMPGLPICVTEYYDPKRPGLRCLGAYSWTNGTPETAPTMAHGDPLSWHSSKKFITGRGWLVEKDADGVRLGENAEHRSFFSPTWGRYSPSSGPKGGLPYWPDDAPAYEARPRLVWSDPEMMQRVDEFVEHCAALSAQARQEKMQLDNEAYRYVNPLLEQIRATQEAAAYARFVEDFGADAVDLWPTHLKSLGLRENPVHPRTLWGIVAIALQHGHPVVGQTIDALAEYAFTEHNNRAPGEWHPGSKKVDVGEFGALVFPEPTPVDDDGEGD